MNTPKIKNKNPNKTNNKNVFNNTKLKSEKTKPLSNTFYTTSLLAVFISIKVYLYLTQVQTMPDTNMDSWWDNNETMSQQDTSIRRYKIVFPDSADIDLSKRFELHRVRGQAKSFRDSHFSYGFNSEVLEEIFSFWRYKYNLREREKYFNKYDQFVTNIEGLDIHFVHVKPVVPVDVKVYPILMLHSWPGSIREFYEVIPFLTNKRLDSEFVFEVIVPTLPGFGYSQAPNKPGLTPYKIAIIMNKLMTRLDIDAYFLQAGDIGHEIATHVATMFPKRVLGYHTTSLIHHNGVANLVWSYESLWPRFVFKREMEDRRFLSEKPDSLGPSLQDSPLGLAAYIMEPFLIPTDPSLKNQSHEVFNRISLTDLMDNVILYWFSGSITTSLRVYSEFKKDDEVANIISSVQSSVPTWGLRSKQALHQPDFLLRRKFTKYVGSTVLEEGGHYLAMELPHLLADDIFKAVNKFLKLCCFVFLSLLKMEFSRPCNI